MSSTKHFLGIDPNEWNRFAAIPEPSRIPKYDGNFDGEDFRGHSGKFIEWTEKHCFDIDRESGQYQPFRFTPEQKEFAEEAFSTDRKGELEYTTVVNSAPRREGKTQLFAYYDLYRIFNYPYQRVTVGSNSAEQAEETAYHWIVSTIRNSPTLRDIHERGLIRVTKESTEFLVTHSKIERVTSNAKSAYGRKISVAHLTEVSEAPDSSLYDALAGSTGDSKDGIVLVDSTVGSRTNLVWQLIQLAKEKKDSGLYVHYKFYNTFDDALRNAPEWISRRWLSSIHAQMHPGKFRKLHLNLLADGDDRFFTEEQWQNCILPKTRAPINSRYIEKEILPRFVKGRAIFGTGLDAASSYGRKPDRTVLTLVLKGTLKEKYLKRKPKIDLPGSDENNIDDRSEYWVIDSRIIPRADDAEIKRLLKRWHFLYRLRNSVHERYETDSISLFCERDGIPFEPVAPTTPNQRDAFDLFYKIVAEQRLYIPHDLWLLMYEGYYFVSNDEEKAPKFGYKKSFKEIIEVDGEKRTEWLKDDSIYSLAWAIRGLRGIDPASTTLGDLYPWQGSEDDDDRERDPLILEEY